MTWRVAESLLELREEIDAFAPDRSTEFDGTIGDEEHAGRKSDHNPSIKDSNGTGVVSALDVTHDPAGGLDAGGDAMSCRAARSAARTRRSAASTFSLSLRRFRTSSSA